MMSYYGVVFPEFWTGRTGRELRAHGKDAQLLGLYLATNRHANMIGLYRLLLDDVRHETGLGVKALTRGLSAVEACQFARFDSTSSYTWVLSMARFRLGLKLGDSLDPDDNRVPAVNRMYHALESNTFLGEFFDVNHRILRLKKRREVVSLVVDPTSHHQMSGLEGAYQGACKPGTEIRDQDQGQDQKIPTQTRPVPGRASCCTYCGATAKQTGFALEDDHVLPRNAGGSDDPSNRVLACHRCNQAKAGRVFASIDEARAWLHHAYWTSNRKRWIEHRKFAFGGQPPAGLDLAEAVSLSARELQEAKEIRSRAHGGCRHEPRCLTFDECVRTIALSRRQKAAS